MPIKRSLILYSCIAVFLSSCSTHKLQQTTESKKNQFEQAFAEQCVEKEIRNSINKDVDRLRYTKPCRCIAKRMTGNLPVREMDKFLFEQKITHSLRMAFDKAAYFCVQNVSQPKSKFQVGRKP